MSLRGTMIQSFHWYTSNEGNFWTEWSDNFEDLGIRGFTSVWLPPAYKGFGGTNDVGYGVYDLFDFGEFDQKGTVRTKYGTKEEYETCIESAHDAGIEVYADVVVNHKMGADYRQLLHNVQIVDKHNRNQPLSDYHSKELWTYYNFPGRGDTYSSMKWEWWHFDATKEYGNIYKLKGKNFETHVDHENVNYDFLMGCDLDYDHPQVRGEIHYWGKWYLDNYGIDGFRIDAIKHIRSFIGLMTCVIMLKKMFLPLVNTGLLISIACAVILIRLKEKCIFSMRHFIIIFTLHLKVAPVLIWVVF